MGHAWQGWWEPPESLDNCDDLWCQDITLASVGKGIDGREAGDPSRCVAWTVWWEVWVIGAVLYFEEGMMDWEGPRVGTREQGIKDAEVPGKGPRACLLRWGRGRSKTGSSPALSPADTQGLALGRRVHHQCRWWVSQAVRE